ncbi:hypothetical protein GE21DRAFT_1109373 [Neurospora crassa]|nr:hypothetical protein GE21DRAFT_1109373 [Neurospora crassa]
MIRNLARPSRSCDVHYFFLLLVIYIPKRHYTTPKPYADNVCNQTKTNKVTFSSSGKTIGSKTISISCIHRQRLTPHLIRSGRRPSESKSPNHFKPTFIQLTSRTKQIHTRTVRLNDPKSLPNTTTPGSPSLSTHTASTHAIYLSLSLSL